MWHQKLHRHQRGDFVHSERNTPEERHFVDQHFPSWVRDMSFESTAAFRLSLLVA
jgi:hypothetical protein